MEIYFSEQAILLVFAIGTGAVISLFFDIFRIIRAALPHPAFLVAIEDIIFSLGALCMTIAFFVRHTNGQIRGFLLFGIATGFIICHISIGALIMLQVKLILKLLGIILYPFKLLFIQICKLLKKFVLFLKKTFIFLIKQVIIIKKYCPMRKRGGKSGGKNKNKGHKPVR